MSCVSFVLASTAHGAMIINRHDRAEMNAITYGLGHQLLTHGAYDPVEVAQTRRLLTFLRRYRGDGVLALDGGANVGVMTLEWARWTEGWGSVIGVEPQERLFWALAGNVALNNLGNVELLNCALGETDGWEAMPLPDYDRQGSFGSVGLRAEDSMDVGQDFAGRTAQVRMRRVDDVVGDRRLGLLKLDLEGGEIEALTGAEVTVRRDEPVLWVEHLKTGVERLVEWMVTRGYAPTVVGLNVLGLPRADPLRDHVGSIVGR